MKHVRHLLLLAAMLAALALAAPSSGGGFDYLVGHVVWTGGTNYHYCDVVIKEHGPSGDRQRAAFYRVTDQQGNFKIPYLVSQTVTWGVYARYNTGTCAYISNTIWRTFSSGTVNVGTLTLGTGCFRI